jgi:hypothetical protein
MSVMRGEDGELVVVCAAPTWVRAPPRGPSGSTLTDVIDDLGVRHVNDYIDKPHERFTLWAGGLIGLAGLPTSAAVRSDFADTVTAPGTLTTPPTAFVSGDDLAAKQLVRTVLHDLGWDDDWVLDLGGISTARGTEAMALMVPSLLSALGFAPFALTVAR